MPRFRMQLALTFSGLTCLLLAATLAGIGHYDGVLVDPAPEALAPNGRSVAVTLRVVATDEALDGAQLVARLTADQAIPSVVPAALAEAVAQPVVFVPVRVEGLESDTPVFARFATDQAPAPGRVLVVEGELRAHAILIEDPVEGLRTEPLILLVPSSVHEPILFA